MLNSVKDLVGALLVAGTKYVDHKRIRSSELSVSSVHSHVGNSVCVRDRLYEGPWYRLKKLEDAGVYCWL